ncbi:MAG: PD-(D/E)XK nuclease family protein [Acidimicrobiia bacterium]|nr:PD-(D/E)XK nuclease family protein [Acidimicrobiia bacterium]
MGIFDHLASGGSFNVSATLYTAYLECPQRALGRLQGFYGKPSIASFKGQLAHKIFATHFDEGEIRDEDFSHVCRVAAGTHFGGTMGELRMSKSGFDAIVLEIQALYDRFKALPFDGFRATEMEFDLDAGGGITVRGSMDAVFDSDDGVRIVDWKTGTHLSDKQSQLEFYAMVWKLLNDEIPATAEAMSVATGENVHLEPTEESVLATQADVGAMIEDLRRAMATGTDLERRAGPYCAWCPLLEDCAEGRKAIEIL